MVNKLSFLKSKRRKRGSTMSGVLVVAMTIAFITSVLVYFAAVMTHQVVETRLNSTAYAMADSISEGKQVSSQIASFYKNKLGNYSWYMDGYEVIINGYKYVPGASNMSKSRIVSFTESSAVGTVDVKDYDTVEVIIKSVGSNFLQRAANGTMFSDSNSDIKVIAVGEAVIDGKPY